MEEREAEIFAGIVLLPNAEIQKWMATYDDIMRPDVIARMSVHYQISFGAAYGKSNATESYST